MKGESLEVEVQKKPTLEETKKLVVDNLRVELFPLGSTPLELITSRLMYLSMASGNLLGGKYDSLISELTEKAKKEADIQASRIKKSKFTKFTYTLVDEIQEITDKILREII